MPTALPGAAHHHLCLVHVQLRRHGLHLPAFFLEAGLVHRKLLGDLRARLAAGRRDTRVMISHVGAWGVARRSFPLEGIRFGRQGEVPQVARGDGSESRSDGGEDSTVRRGKEASRETWSRGDSTHPVRKSIANVTRLGLFSVGMGASSTNFICYRRGAMSPLHGSSTVRW